MGDFLFLVGKIVGLVAKVEMWIILGLILTLVSHWRGKRRAVTMFGLISLLLVAGLTAFPLGNLVLSQLESRYPAHPDLDSVDGIIVLGGAENVTSYRRWGGVQVNDAAERLIAGAELARRFPDAKLIFTGAIGRLADGGDPLDPSRIARDTWLAMGIPTGRIVLETASRTTTENARMIYELIPPLAGQHYILVTSAFHMPRSMESFSRAGWQNLTAWPVDFRSGNLTEGIAWNLGENLTEMNIALKEVLGIMAYRLTGR